MAFDPASKESEAARIDGVLQEWRQGDCIVGEQWFAYRVDTSIALTEAAENAIQSGADLAESEVRGLVVVSQTCDLVRSSLERPFVEVSPLVEVGAQEIRQIERGYRPRYAYVPGVADQRLVADLDRTMTVEKTVVARWARVQGCREDVDVRRFAAALARKRARKAFPDDFSRFVAKLQSRIQEKHDKNSAEGRALAALTEIRVQATPSWAESTVEITFLFVRPSGSDSFEGKRWSDYLEEWLRLVPEAGRFTKVLGQVTTHSRMTAADYLSSDQLDLDHLSTPSPRGAK